jgi:hypothetical protein
MQRAFETIDCRKSESRLSLLYEQFRFRMASPTGFRSGARISKEEAVIKILVRFMPYNPLISLDSDERIQGNPR